MEHGFTPLGLLEISFEESGQDTLVLVTGELDLLSQPRFSAELDRAAVETTGRLVLDADGVRFIDACGLRAIVEMHRRLGLRFVVRAASPQVRRLLDLTGLEHLLEVAATSPKVAYVRRLCDAFVSGGAEAIADLVPDLVEWRPWTSSRTLHGTRELREFWSSRALPISATDITEVGADVVVRVRVPLADGATKELWSVLHFDGEFLAGTASFEDRDDALAAAV